MEFRLVAGIQLIYLFLPMAIFVVVVDRLAEVIAMMLLSEQPLSFQIGVAAFAAIPFAGYIVMGVTALATWRGDHESVQAFYRWFPLYLLLDLLSALIVLHFAIEYVNVVAGLLVLPVLVYLPFWQRRLAGKILAGGGG